MIKNININDFLSKYNETEFLNTFKELSKGSNGYLVNSEEIGYNFDAISKDLLNGNKLKSTDSIVVKNDVIYFIEFKTGFKKIINYKNFDFSLWKCETTGKCCQDGLRYFKQYHKSTLNEMKLSIHLKLIEIFFILDKFILPNCSNAKFSYKLKFIAVIDGVNDAPLDMIESGLNSLSKIESKNNFIDDFEKSLKKYIVKDSKENNLLFDEVKVLQKEEFDRLFSYV